jgi:hypothetical protein
MERYMTTQEHNHELSNDDVNSIGLNNESSSSIVVDHHKNNESSSSSAESASVNSKIWNFRKPIFKCRHCNAYLWYEEMIRPNTHTKNPYFGICCQNGKISLPARSEPPTFLEELLSGQNQKSKKIQKNIRSYNSMFAFTSTSGVVDKEINKGYGPYVFLYAWSKLPSYRNSAARRRK